MKYTQAERMQLYSAAAIFLQLTKNINVIFRLRQHFHVSLVLIYFRLRMSHCHIAVWTGVLLNWFQFTHITTCTG